MNKLKASEKVHSPKFGIIDAETFQLLENSNFEKVSNSKITLEYFPN